MRMNNKEILVSGSKFCKIDIVILVLAGLLSLITLIANPSYFSHDEWQRFDYFSNHGLLTYMQWSLHFSAGSGFGTPIRPVAFFLQGIHSIFFQNYPFIVHLMSAVNTIFIGIAVYMGCLRFRLCRRTAILSAVLFMINPLTTLATGWSAALMDQLYVSFGLLALYLADSYILEEKKDFFKLLLISTCGMLGVLSKETGIVFPATLLILLALNSRVYISKWRRLLMAWVAWVAPIILYLLFRASAIQASFGTDLNIPYAASFNFVVENIFTYWLYPFHPLISEPITMWFQPIWSLWVAFIIHCLLVLAIAVIFRWKTAALYLFSYFLFLVPVLFIQQKGAHYLFASAMPLSIAVACIATARKTSLKVFGILLAALLIYHGLFFQLQIYRDGRCMNRIVTTLEANYYAAGFPKNVYFTNDWDAPAHVLYRLISARTRVGDHEQVNLKAYENGFITQQSDLVLKLDNQCLLSRIIPK